MNALPYKRYQWRNLEQRTVSPCVPDTWLHDKNKQGLAWPISGRWRGLSFFHIQVSGACLRHTTGQCRPVGRCVFTLARDPRRPAVVAVPRSAQESPDQCARAPTRARARAPSGWRDSAAIFGRVLGSVGVSEVQISVKRCCYVYCCYFQRKSEDIGGHLERSRTIASTSESTEVDIRYGSSFNRMSL